MMVNVGLNLIRNLMSTGGGTAPTHGEVGSNNTAITATDTALLGSYFRQSFTANTVSDRKNQYETLISSTSANGTTMRAFAIFNASESGTMVSAATFPDLSKTADIDVQFDANITYTNV